MSMCAAVPYINYSIIILLMITCVRTVSTVAAVYSGELRTNRFLRLLEEILLLSKEFVFKVKRISAITERPTTG